MALYNLRNARSETQRSEMERLERAGICIFCPAGLAGATRAVLDESDAWVLTENQFPYADTRRHLLLFPRRHVADLLELPSESLAEFWMVLRDLKARESLNFYGLGARCGDFHATGGTIEHVHVHVVVGDVDDPAHEPVRLKLSSRRPAE